ncbi:MAG: M20 aminoacylase family protein [Rhodovarius sp.]|nr:M20 family metallopeptidase [Rhodovarius sp.]MCX7931496.1 M20 family metallopeptidase [Rhodovarius sp.]MDW8314944.1 M20 aminoacylase family protein [Rhodovarius sp.]
MPIPNRIAALTPEIAAWRRDFHAHPELGFQELRTSALVAERLESFGIEVHRGIATTGVVGVLRQGDSGRVIGLRADMDCLPMTEETGLPHASTSPGRMHACGHDGHTAVLLGAAKYLAETRNFDGTVVFLFQPAEEGGGGGRVMVEEGVMERFGIQQVYGLHNDPLSDLGTISVVAGPILAAADGVTFRIRGRGGHAARPHLAIDPVLIGSQLVVQVQSIVSRRTDPLDSVVVSLCMFHAGSASNVIPETAEIAGTIRTLKAATRDAVEGQIRRIAAGLAEAHECEIEVDYRRGYPVTVNHAEETERAARAAARVFGEANVVRSRPPIMGAEDFSYMLEARPGCFVQLGQRGPDGKGGVPVHHPRYDFNDDAIPYGIAFFAALVEQELARG